MYSARILIVDDDPWTQRMVSAVLAHAGHAVEIASDGWEGLIRIGRARPDLVITEVKLPTTDGWSFVETLRSRPDAARVPVIFLSTFTADRTPGRSFRPDTDDCLLKPFRLEQLEEKVRAALCRARGIPWPAAREESRPTPTVVTAAASWEPQRVAPPQSGPVTPIAPMPAVRRTPERAWRTILTGALSEFGLSSILIVLELERKSGALVLQGPATEGRIVLRGGRVIRAQLDDGSARRGAVAVYDLLTWTQGRFDFKAGEPEGEDEIGSSTSFLLMEGARLQDEGDHHEKARN